MPIQHKANIVAVVTCIISALIAILSLCYIIFKDYSSNSEDIRVKLAMLQFTVTANQKYVEKNEAFENSQNNRVKSKILTIESTQRNLEYRLRVLESK